MTSLADHLPSAWGLALSASSNLSKHSVADSIVCRKSVSHSRILYSSHWFKGSLNLNRFVAFGDRTNLITRASGRINVSFNLRNVGRRTYDHHSNPHVEGAKHLRLVDVADLLHDFKYCQHRPRAFLNLYCSSFRQNTRNIFRQAAAG